MLVRPSSFCLAACLLVGSADYPAWNWLQRPDDMPLRPLARLA